MNSHLGTWELTPEDYQLTEQLKRAREQKLYEDVDYCGLPSTSKLWNVIHERMSSSREDIRSAGFWRAVVAEYIGTAIVVLVGCGAWIGNWGDQPSIVQVALAFGLAVSLVMWTLRHVSRSHLNPAISIAMVMSRRISLARALAYTIVQCLGAATGVGILKGATPSTQIGTLGATTPHPDITAAQAFTVEMVITFVWVFALFATSDPNRDDLPDSAPMCIGMAVTICHLYAVSTNCGHFQPICNNFDTIYSTKCMSWLNQYLEPFYFNFVSMFDSCLSLCC